MEGASPSKKRRKEVRQRKESYTGNNAPRRSMHEVQCYVKDDGLSAIFLSN